LLLAPPEGVVSSVVVSATDGGPPVDRLAPGAKEIYARFRFASRPQAKCTSKKVKVRVKGKSKSKVRRVCKPRTITVTWFSPAGKPAAPPLKKPNTTTIETFVKTNAVLDPGTWRVELRIGGVLVMDATAIVPAA
jgi:hypothetical protein